MHAAQSVHGVYFSAITSFLCTRKGLLRLLKFPLCLCVQDALGPRSSREQDRCGPVLTESAVCRDKGMNRTTPRHSNAPGGHGAAGRARPCPHLVDSCPVISTEGTRVSAVPDTPGEPRWLSSLCESEVLASLDNVRLRVTSVNYVLRAPGDLGRVHVLLETVL